MTEDSDLLGENVFQRPHNGHPREPGIQEGRLEGQGVAPSLAGEGNDFHSHSRAIFAGEDLCALINSGQVDQHAGAQVGEELLLGCEGLDVIK